MPGMTRRTKENPMDRTATITREDPNSAIWTITCTSDPVVYHPEGWVTGTTSAKVYGMSDTVVRYPEAGTSERFRSIRPAILYLARNYGLTAAQVRDAGLPIIARLMDPAVGKPAKPAPAEKPARIARPQAERPAKPVARTADGSPYSDTRGIQPRPDAEAALSVLRSLSGDASDPRWMPAMAAYAAAMGATR